MKRYILLLVALAAMCGLRAQQVEVEGRVESTEVQVGKPFTFDLSLKVPYGWFVEWNDFAQESLSDQIDIVKRSNVERTADADSNIIVRQQLTLMTFDTGRVELPAVALTYAHSFDAPLRMQAYTEPVDLYVTTITADTLQPYKPIVEPIAAPIQMKEVFPWVLVALLAILLGLGIWLLLKRRKVHVDADGNVVKDPVIPPYDKAVDDLRKLREEKPWQSGKVKEYFSSLTDIAREYIEGQFGVNAVEMTTDDILEEIKPLHFSKEAYDKLKDTMEVADLVKFAKYSASSFESDTALTNMTEFVKVSYEHYQNIMSSSATSQTDSSDSGTQSATREEVKDA